ncbi:hypothetical protein BI347_21215 [Chromobacterium sphagni]|uniref:Uncharacterized protein n=1 Tax=Chromobacterium sphagni TaxID=1903179 RepID=A0A1S1WSY9_9NEIS|nr:hypothetical protein BI347_21215 [Chromobacterium sphagni]
MLLAAQFCAAPAWADDLVLGAGKCGELRDIGGVYHCSGECVVTASDGSHSLTQVSGEEDRIRRFDGARWMYQIDIVGGGGFAEQEIGGLSGHALQAVTAHVSDQQYPVLEEYVFEMDGSCRASKYVKTVRNPNPVAMKACSLVCVR